MDRQVYDRMRALEQDHWWFTARREILAAEIGRLGLPADARLLEVGCGAGGNLALLSRFGQVEAIEPDGPSRSYAAERTGVLVRDGTLPDGLPAFAAPFDLIAAFDVIEHVADDAGAVAALGRLLKPGAAMITTVPANPWMWSAHDRAHHHHRRYTMAGYRRLFDAAGLQVVRSTHFNTLLYPPIAAVRLLKKAARIEGGDEESKPADWLNGLLRRTFAAERRLLEQTRLPFGVSILMVARAPT